MGDLGAHHGRALRPDDGDQHPAAVLVDDADASPSRARPVSASSGASSARAGRGAVRHEHARAWGPARVEVCDEPAQLVGVGEPGDHDRDVRAFCSASAIARSSASVRTSRHNGTTKATTTAVVVATTSSEIRRRISRLTRVPWGVRVDEPDADAPHAQQVTRLGRRLAQLAPQPRQVDVDGACRLPPYGCRHTSSSSSFLVTTSTCREASKCSRSNSLRRQLQRLAVQDRRPRALRRALSSPTTIGGARRRHHAAAQHRTHAGRPAAPR